MAPVFYIILSRTRLNTSSRNLPFSPESQESPLLLLQADTMDSEEERGMERNKKDTFFPLFSPQLCLNNFVCFLSQFWQQFFPEEVGKQQQQPVWGDFPQGGTEIPEKANLLTIIVWVASPCKKISRDGTSFYWILIFLCLQYSHSCSCILGLNSKWVDYNDIW